MTTKILVIDDDSIGREAITISLKQKECEVVCVSRMNKIPFGDLEKFYKPLKERVIDLVNISHLCDTYFESKSKPKLKIKNNWKQKRRK